MVAATVPPFRWTAEHDEFRAAVRKLTALGRTLGPPRDRHPYADRPFEERPHD